MKDLFPAWASAGRSKPLDLRRWFLGAERVCRSYYLDEHDWGRAVALVLPAGAHQEWLWRYIERAAKDATWTALVEAFVAVFQQQSSLDLLEAEWDALQLARYELCYCVLCKVC